MKFQLKPIADKRTGLFINDKFAGNYSEYFGISQFSGNENQIFDVNLCVKFLRTIKPEVNIFSAISIAGNQMYLQVRFEPIILQQGVNTIHKPN